MARRPKRPETIPDWNLWVEVTRSVSPLPRRQLPEPVGELEPETVLTAAPRPRAPMAPFLPSYSPGGATGVQMQPGRIIEPKMRKKLMRGRIEIDATLDLHGMRQNEARSVLHRFIAARQARGDRTILVITGKGLKKTDAHGSHVVERGVLRHMLPLWLSEPSLAPLIGGWDTSAQQHGGEGAFYVRLRRSE